MIVISDVGVPCDTAVMNRCRDVLPPFWADVGVKYRLNIQLSLLQMFR